MDWRNWCRFCGDWNSIHLAVKLEQSQIESIIKQFFPKFQENDIRICNDCLKFVSDIERFINKANSIQNMFTELNNCSAKEEEFSFCDLDEIRIRFGLNELNVNSLDFLNEVLEETSIKQEKPEEIHDLKYEFSDDNITDTFDNDFVDDSLNKVDSLANEKTIKKAIPKKKVKKKLDSQVSDDQLYDYVCHICSAKFDRFEPLRKHCKKQHNSLPAVSCICGRVYGCRKRLLEHKRTHFPELIAHQCKICKKHYTLKSAYDQHMKEKHSPGSQSFQCSQCDRTYFTPGDLKKHTQSHLPDEQRLIYSCDLCPNKAFTTKGSMKTHFANVHIRDSSFTCEKCGKNFFTKGGLKEHQTVHKERSVKCDQCPAAFKSTSSLTRHREQLHSNITYTCSICSYTFKSKITFRRHSRVHSDERKYKCTYCPNEYKRREALKIHLNTHTGERPYQCPFCTRTFADSSNRRKHKLKDHPQELAEFEAVHGKGKVELEVA